MTNGISCEYDMQAAFIKFLNKLNKRELKLADRLNTWTKYNAKLISYKDEFHVSAVSRRADFLIYKPYKGLINVEAKCLDWKCLLNQLEDHATYCDYCFAYIPDYAPTPKWFKGELVKKGYGLIIYNYHNTKVTEVLEAHLNKNINRLLRNTIIDQIKQVPKEERQSRRTA